MYRKKTLSVLWQQVNISCRVLNKRDYPEESELLSLSKDRKSVSFGHIILLITG